MIVLKRLSQARRDGDRVYAVILGSAVAHDGRSNGLMAPNPKAQALVLHQAYRDAGVSPGQIQYVEAHGTGTYLGDPIEARALGEVLAQGRPSGSNCMIGSVKTNIGHLEAGAGVAGVIKTALALHHGQLPPSLHFNEPNPLIPFEKLQLQVQQELGDWRAQDGRRLAGVSSFGFGGTNAHAVLQGVSEEETPTATDGDGPPHLLAFSARSQQALDALAASYEGFLIQSAGVFANVLPPS